MKIIVTAFFLAVGCIAFSQNTVVSSTLFAQGLFEESSEQRIKDIELDIRALPFVKIARLDVFSKRFFILTKDIDSLSEQQLRSWFDDLGSTLSCVQIGVQGITAINPFPFVNCPN